MIYGYANIICKQEKRVYVDVFHYRASVTYLKIYQAYNLLRMSRVSLDLSGRSEPNICFGIVWLSATTI